MVELNITTKHSFHANKCKNRWPSRTRPGHINGGFTPFQIYNNIMVIIILGSDRKRITNWPTNQTIVVVNPPCLTHISTNRIICQELPLQTSLASYCGSTSNFYPLYAHIHFLSAVSQFICAWFSVKPPFWFARPNLIHNQFWVNVPVYSRLGQ
jgi:hypothetical protein